jgi:hypothetical protein
MNIFAEFFLANHHNILGLIKILGFFKKISYTVLAAKRRFKSSNIKISLGVVCRVLKIAFVIILTGIINHLLQLTLISIVTSIFSVENLEEIFLYSIYFSLFFQELVNVSNLEIVFEIIPFFVGLWLIRI